MNAARAFWLTGKGRGALRREALPDPAPGWCVVRTLFSAVSPGTERLVSLGGVPAGLREEMACPYMGGGFPFPVKYGYSLVGEVVEGPRELRGRVVHVLHPHQDLCVVRCGRCPAPSEGTAAGPGHPGQQHGNGRYGRLGLRRIGRRARPRRRLRRRRVSRRPGPRARSGRRSRDRRNAGRAAPPRGVDGIPGRARAGDGVFRRRLRHERDPGRFADGHRQRRRRRPGRRRELVRRAARAPRPRRGLPQPEEEDHRLSGLPHPLAPCGPAGTRPGGPGSSSACSSGRNSTSTSDRSSPSPGCPRPSAPSSGPRARV